jgi:hypothetical protein
MDLSVVYSLVLKKSPINLEINDVGVIKKIENNKFHVFFIRLKKIVVVEKKDIGFLEAKNYGDHALEKICNICHKILPTDNFDLNQNGKGDRPVRRPSCKKCREVIDGVAMKSKEKREWEKSKPKLQEFECPICSKITIPGLTSKVVLNHDHASGKIFGWICDSCNTGLGRFKDDIKILNKAIKYLKKE